MNWLKTGKHEKLELWSSMVQSQIWKAYYNKGVEGEGSRHLAYWLRHCLGHKLPLCVCLGSKPTSNSSLHLFAKADTGKQL